MNSSIKARQTRLVNWLAKTLNCKPITIAQTGSYYTEFNTQYTGKSVIRISDHLSNDRTYIHVILSPLNTTVIVNYKNFIWNGTFTDAKSIIYTLIMSKAMTELSNPIPKETTPVKVTTVKTASKADENTVYSSGCTTKNHPIRLSLLTSNGLKLASSFIKVNRLARAKELDLVYFTKNQYKMLIKEVMPCTVSGVVKSGNSYCIDKNYLAKLSTELQNEVFNWLQIKDLSEITTQYASFTENQYNVLKPYLK